MKRFPTAPDGFIVYQRTITVNEETAENIREDNAVLVVHGIDANDSGAYDGEAKSALNPALPLEATAPAACGTVDEIATLGGALELGGVADLNLDEILDSDWVEDFTSDFNSLGEAESEFKTRSSR